MSFEKLDYSRYETFVPCLVHCFNGRIYASALKGAIMDGACFRSGNFMVPY